MRTPGGRVIVPDAFVQVAEKAGLIDALDGARQACADGAQWRAADPAFVVSVNLSALGLTQVGAADRVEQVLADARLDPHGLCLEITESTMLSDTEAHAAMARLRALGVHFAIDDFGTGYSSLAHLRRMPVDVLKIDRSFVSGLHATIQDRALVTAAIDLGRTFGLSITAEGVETPEQRDELVQLGCDRGQGYLWSRPVDAGQILPLLRCSLRP